MKNHLLLLVTVIFIFTASLCKAQTYYGMTFKGGADNNAGAIISFNAATNAESVVWNLGNASDGANPLGSLVYDSSNGLFYGLTSFGGNNNKGAIISFDPNTNRDSVVWSFAGSPSDGEIPYGSLVYDSAKGLLYGMTYGGGNAGINDGDGVIFSFNPTGNVETVLWYFNGSPTDGAVPQGNLVYDAGNGLFYGMTTFGGSNVAKNFGGGGILFSFNPTTNRDSVLWNFGSGTDGANPFGSLVYYSGNGLFYGMTIYGGTNDTTDNGDGTIFSFNATGNAENLLWNFGNGNDGKQPDGSLVYDASNGLFYGMTQVGGSNLGGTIISFNPIGNSENVAWNFGSGNDAKRPYGDLVYDSENGLFYGMTVKGGTEGTGNGDGAIFSFNPTGNAENVLWNLGSGTDGQQPYGNLVLYPPSATGINTFNKASTTISIYPNPFTSQTTIEFGEEQKNTIITITDLLGKEIKAINFTGKQLMLDKGEMSNGIYFVRITDEKKNVVNKKIIVQ